MSETKNYSVLVPVEEPSDIEKFLSLEIREQKRTASGIHGRAARLRKKEFVTFPSDNLTGFEKKLIKAPGVVTYSTIGEVLMSDLMKSIKRGTVPKREEFLNLENEAGFAAAQEAAAEFRRLYTNAQILKAWKSTGTTVTNFFKHYQIAKLKGGSVLIGEKAMERFAGLKRKNLTPVEDTLKAAADVIVPEVIEPSKPALVSIDETIGVNELNKFLEGLGMFLGNIGDRFDVKIQVRRAEIAEA